MGIYDWIRYGLLFFEMLACITGFIYWDKLRGTYWRWFPVYLLVIVSIELLAGFVSDGVNFVMYLYFGIPIQFLFFCWLFYRYFEHTKRRKWALTGMAVYVAAWVVDVLFLQDTQLWFLSFSYTVGNVILAILVLLFFFRFINSEEILQYKTHMMFWVCLGLLIFYLGSLPFWGLYNTIKDETKYPGVRNTYWIFQMAFDYMMYIFFTIAFVWGKAKS